MKNTVTTFICIFFSLNLFAQTEKEVKNSNQDSDNKLAIQICGASYLAWMGGEPIERLEYAILSTLGVSLNHPNRSQIISDFFNDNHDKLICNKNNSQKFRDNEHLFKRAIAMERYDYIYHLAGNDEYSVNFNAYEIINGKKETLLDYVDMILSDTKKKANFNIDELKMLRLTLVEIGVVKGEEL